MAFLYHSLRKVLRYALELYFVDTRATGQEHVPPWGPVIFAANHPNSIMDSVILGAHTPRTIHYLARSGLFDNPLVATLFDQCGVIPVYRTQDAPQEGPDGPDAARSNEGAFRRAFDVLEAGQALGIFPEGQNSQARKVLEIKTGTARIALGAEARKDYRLGVRIVPVGLNFDARDRFLSRVLVRFARPIYVADFAELHRRDPRAAVRALTERIQADLREAATHIDDERHHQLVAQIKHLYGRELLDDLLPEAHEDSQEATHRRRALKDWFFNELRATPEERPDLERMLQIEQHIGEAVAWFEQHEPDVVAAIRQDLHRYQDHLEQVRIRHDLVTHAERRLSWRKEALRFTLYALCFGPVALWGFVHNALALALVRRFALGAPDEAMRAIRAFGLGLALFPSVYIACAALLWHFAPLPLIGLVLYLASLPLSGFFYLRYRRQVVRYRNRILARTLGRTRGQLVRELARERRALGARLDALRERFVQARLQEELAGLVEQDVRVGSAAVGANFD